MPQLEHSMAVNGNGNVAIVGGCARETEALLLAVLNAPTADSTLIVDRAGTILAVNDVAALRLGRPIGDLMGRCLYDQFEPALARSRRESIEATFATGHAARFEDTRMGNVFDNHIVPVCDASGTVTRAVVFARDITEEQRAKAEKARLEQFYRYVLEHLPLELSVRDAQGRYEYVNPAAEPDTEMRAWMIGRTDTEYWARQDVDPAIGVARANAIAACVQSGDSVGYEESLPGDDGGARYFERRFSPVYDTAGGVARVIAYGLDITERRRAEQEATLRHEQLVQADKMVLLGILVSSVAHEVSNPNQYLMSSLAVIERGWQGAWPVLEEYFKTQGEFSMGGVAYSQMRQRLPDAIAAAQGGARRIRDIVRDLRDFARGTPQTAREWVDVSDVARSSVALVGALIERHTSQFKLELAAELPAVLGHAQRIEQVVVNLLVNACQALRDRNESVTLRTVYLPETREVLLQVQDGGAGMNAETLARLTEPFYTTKRERGGLGLGLSISRTIIEEHHGKLEFASVDGEGATATVRLVAGADSIR